MNASTIVITLAKSNQSTKYMLKVANKMLANGKSSKFKLKQQNTRTTLTLFWCSSYELGALHMK